VKLYAGEVAAAGVVLVRQRGAHYRPGLNVRLGSDDTLYAAVAGRVRFQKRIVKRFTGERVTRTFVSVEAQNE
jgi:large subunit ribosomal protein L27